MERKGGVRRASADAQGVFEFCRDLSVKPKRRDRLFFALLANAKTSSCVEQFRQSFLHENDLRGKPIDADRLHVSLHHVDEYVRLRTKFIYAATQSAKAVSMRSFAATFRFIKSFEDLPQIGGRPRKRPLVLLGEGEGLLELHRSLGAAMKKNGLKAAAYFTPHMTLLYDWKAIPLQAIEPIRFVVDEFALIHSELGLTRYNIIDRWSLRS